MSLNKKNHVNKQQIKYMQHAYNVQKTKFSSRTLIYGENNIV